MAEERFGAGFCLVDEEEEEDGAGFVSLGVRSAPPAADAFVAAGT